MGLKPILAAGLAAGMAMFLFQAAIHATPYAHPGLESMAREGLIIDTLDSGVGGQSGYFYFPGDRAAPPTRRSGLLLFHEDNKFLETPADFALELAKDLLQGLVFAYLLSLVAGNRSRRFAAVVATGALVSISVLGSNWIWYAFPGTYILGQMAIVMLGYVVGGSIAAATLQRKVS
jgi:hypothetical protein